MLSPETTTINSGSSKVPVKNHNVETIGTENRSVVARAWGEGRTLTQRDTGELSGLMEGIYTLNVVVVTGLHTFVRIHRTRHLK